MDVTLEGRFWACERFIRAFPMHEASSAWLENGTTREWAEIVDSSLWD
jgi:hypothetical protein